MNEPHERPGPGKAACPFCAAEMDLRRRRLCASCGAERLEGRREILLSLAGLLFVWFLLPAALAAALRRLLLAFGAEPSLAFGLGWSLAGIFALILSSPQARRASPAFRRRWRSSGEIRRGG